MSTWKERRGKIAHVVGEAVGAMVTGELRNFAVKGDVAQEAFQGRIHEIVREIRDDPTQSGKTMTSEIFLVVDDNMFYRSMRLEMFEVARQCQAQGSSLLLLFRFLLLLLLLCLTLLLLVTFLLSLADGAGFVQVYLRCPLELALERNAARDPSARVGQETVERMAARLEEPSPEQNPWEACSVVLDVSRGETLTLNGLLELAPRARETVRQLLEAENERVTLEKAREAERMRSTEGVRASWAHQVDIVIRKKISDLLSAAKVTGRPDVQGVAGLAQQLNERRKAILGGLKAVNFAPHATLEAATAAALAQVTESFT